MTEEVAVEDIRKTESKFDLSPMSFTEAWRAGTVARCHVIDVLRRQNVGEHSWGVAMICLSLWPDKPQLLPAALLHDVPERVLGDAPHPAKHICIDREKEKAAEEQLLSGFNHALETEDEVRLLIADIFDYVLMTHREHLMGNQLIQETMRQGLLILDKRVRLIESEEERDRIYKFVGKALEELIQNRGRYLK